jgi:hypothetical protein
MLRCWMLTNCVTINFTTISLGGKRYSKNGILDEFWFNKIFMCMRWRNPWADNQHWLCQTFYICWCWFSWDQSAANCVGTITVFWSNLLRQQIGLMCDFHNLRFNTADGLSFGIGDGGVGLDTQCVIDAAKPPEKRIPRNTSGLFNLVQWI